MFGMGAWLGEPPLAPPPEPGTPAADAAGVGVVAGGRVDVPGDGDGADEEDEAVGTAMGFGPALPPEWTIRRMTPRKSSTSAAAPTGRKD